MTLFKRLLPLTLIVLVVNALSGDEANLPRPKSPNDALSCFSIKPGLDIELVAAEPLIVDPVAFDWGTDGRLWVVEMGDYPRRVDGKGKAGGRVKVLSDIDNDGKYDTASVFLDSLPFPTGVKVWRDGILVTAAPRILFARDTDDDDRADDIRTLYQGFGEGNQQHRVNGIRWGLDNWLYVGNGDSAGVIRSEATGDEVDIRSRDLRILPDAGRLQSISGHTQFGLNRDDWGNWFGGNNSHPAWHYVLDDTYLRRNPHFAPPAVKREISETPGPARVYPTSTTIERFNNPQSANRFTSACSPTVYRDRLLGNDLAGNIFVCEPVHNLIHREIVSADGASFTSRRADGEHESEFLASSDNWFRPTMIRTGPDGALWVSDMYRLVIEHPEWIPEHFQQRYNLRAGADRGRIYRVVRKGDAPQVPRLAEFATVQLVAALESPNGTVRDLAQQMILWKNDTAAIEPLNDLVTDGNTPLARLHALCTLDGLGKVTAELLTTAVNDVHPAVRRHACRVSESVEHTAHLKRALRKLTNDRDLHVRIQLAYSAGEWTDHSNSGAVLGELLSSSDDKYLNAAAMSSLHAENIAHVLSRLQEERSPSNLLTVLAQAGLLGAEDALISSIQKIFRRKDDGRFESSQMKAANDLMSRLAGLNSTEARNRIADTLSPLFMHARDIGENIEADPARLATALALLRWAPPDAWPDSEVLTGLLKPTRPPEIQRAALALVVKKSVSQRTSQLLSDVLAEWSTYTPSLRRELLDALLTRPDQTNLLLNAVADGTIKRSQFNAARRRQLLEHKDESLSKRAANLFGAPANSSRDVVLRDYAAALSSSGDRANGKRLFTKRCAACHRIEGVGHVIGPDLSAITNRSPKALLTAILDPNRAVEDKFLSFSALTEDGRVYNGMLESEAGQSITLRTPDGKSITLLRSQLEEFRSSDRSFMPEGLERELNVQHVTDLIAYLRSLGPAPKTFDGNHPQVVQANATGELELTATAARIYGPRLIFETTYQNLGWWYSDEDRAEWTIDVGTAGEYEVEIEYACEDSSAGNTFKFVANSGQVSSRVAGTGLWENYRSVPIGRLRLNAGLQEVTLQSAGPVQGAMFDVKAIRLCATDREPKEPKESRGRDFEVGFGRRQITPTEGLWMSGYVGPHRVANGVFDDLFAQAMAIRDRSGGRALLLRIDVCTMRDTTIKQICDLIRDRTGLLRQEILVNISHTHSGPAVDELYHYPMSTDDRARLAAYMERLKAMCADAAEDAVKDLKPAVLEFGVGEAKFFHNRRGLDASGRYTGMQANPDNHTDRDIPVLRVSDPDGLVRGVVFGVACHNVTLGVNREYSGDFAGQTRLQLEKSIPNALFVTGCGADANPHRGANGADLVRLHGITLAEEISRVLAKPMKPVRGPLKTSFRYVDLPLITYSSRADIEKMRRGPFANYGTVNKLLSLLDQGAKIPTTFAAPFTVWQFGEDLTLAGLPEETVSEYVTLLKEAVGRRSLWTAGYCNDVSSYLPTVHIMEQGGYETRGFISDLHAGWYSREVEKVVVDAVAKMVDEVTKQVTDHFKPTPIESFARYRFDQDDWPAGFQAIGNVERGEQGIRLDGNSYLEADSLELPDAGQKGLTMAAWVKPDAAGMTGNRMVICQWANEVGKDRFGFGLNDGKPSLGVGDGATGEQGFTCDQSVGADDWTFIAATWDPVTRRYCTYINGKPTSTSGIQTGSGINMASKVTVKIGAQGSEGNPRKFIGQIDDVWLGNALNAAAIEKLYERSRKEDRK